MPEAIERQAQLLESLRQLATSAIGKLGSRDVFIMAAGRFRGGGEDRLREPIAFVQASRKAIAGDRPRPLVILPPGSGDIAPHDALEHDGLRGTNSHAAERQVRLLPVEEFRDELLAAQVIADDRFCLSEPVEGQLIEDPSLLGNRCRQDDVEGGKAVGRDHQQLTLGELVGVADLASGVEGQRKLGCEDGAHGLLTSVVAGTSPTRWKVMSRYRR